MNAVSIQGQCNIDAVVDDDLDAAPSCELDRLRSSVIKISRAKMFFTKLNQRRPAGGKSFDLFGVREAGDADVGYGIDSRQGYHSAFIIKKQSSPLLKYL